MFQDCMDDDNGSCADSCLSSLETYTNDCSPGFPDYITTFATIQGDACSDLFFNYVANIRGTDCEENKNMFATFTVIIGCIQTCSPYCQELQDGVCNNCNPSTETKNLMDLWTKYCPECNSGGGGDSGDGDNDGEDSSAASFATFMAKAALVLSAFMF